MVENKSMFITFIAWVFIISGFLFFILFLLPSVSSSMQLFIAYSNPELVEKTLEESNLHMLKTFYGMNITFIFVTLISFIYFLAGTFLLKRKNWARVFFCKIFLVKIFSLLLATIFFLYLMFENIKMGVLVFSFSFINLIMLLIYRKLSAEETRLEFFK